MIFKDIYKIGIVVLSIQLVATLKRTASRYIIKNWFTSGELSWLRWFMPEFLFNLTFKQLFGLFVIASFTVFTFPLGIWLSSFNMSKSYPIMNIIGSAMNLLTFPLTLNLMLRLKEFEFNNFTWSGIVLIVISKLIIIAGCYFLYLGRVEI